MKTILFLLLSLILSISHAATENTRDATWIGFFSKKEVSSGHYLWTEAQFRYLLDSSGMQQTLYRVGGLKKLNDQHEVGLIYGYIQTGLMKEHRPTLQHTQQYGEIGDAKFSARSRFEFRMLEDSPDDALRFRYMLRLQKPINGGKSLVVWDEPFINLTKDDWTGNRTIERNRFFVGARLPVGELNAEVGYLNQFVPRQKDITEHILTLYLFY